MRLREERIEAISQAIVDALCEEELVDLTIDEEELVHLVSNAILADLAKEDEIQEEAVRWMQHNKPGLQEGTGPWEIELEKRLGQIAIQRGYTLP